MWYQPPDQTAQSSSVPKLQNVTETAYSEVNKYDELEISVEV